MPSRPKILVLVNHYLPGYRAGGPVRSIANMVYWLGDDFSFKILTDDHDLGETSVYPGVRSEVWYTVGKAQVRYLTNTEQRIGNLRRLLQEIDYDAIYLNGVFASSTLKVIFLNWGRQIPSSKIIVAPRGHLNSGALSLKPRKKRLFIRLARWIRLYGGVTWHVSNEAEKADVCREFQVQQAEHIRVISNLPSSQMNDRSEELRPKQSGEVRLLFLSRISPKKNLLYGLDVLKGLRGNIQFDIYGPLEDALYWQQCQAAVSRLPANISVTYKGKIQFDKTQTVFSQYHLFFLPTLGENFGHVILEALSTGCPVLISDQTPWSDVNSTGAGWALSLDRPERFQAAIQSVIDMAADKYGEMSRQAYAYARAYTEKSTLVIQTRQLFQDMLKGGSDD